MVESAPLLREYTLIAYRGFESLSLRQLQKWGPKGPFSFCRQRIARELFSQSALKIDAVKEQPTDLIAFDNKTQVVKRSRPKVDDNPVLLIGRITGP